MKIYFSASEAQREPNDLTGEPPIPLDQPTDVVVDAAEFVQGTYETLRVGPHGDDVAHFDCGGCGFWMLTRQARVERVTTFEGADLSPDTCDYEGWLFTDFVVAQQ